MGWLDRTNSTRIVVPLNGRNNMRLFSQAVLVLCTAVCVWAQHGTPTPSKKASPEDVCSFVTSKVRAAVPQVPILCVSKKSDLNGYVFDVFSPTDVLEGKLRRAWSVALFEALQELYFDEVLGGICYSNGGEQWKGCVVNISDSYLSVHNGKQYMVSLDRQMKQHWPPDVSSDDWYQWWWFVLSEGTTFPHEGSERTARSFGEDTCKSYTSALRKDPPPARLPRPLADSIMFGTFGDGFDSICGRGFFRFLGARFYEL